MKPADPEVRFVVTGSIQLPIQAQEIGGAVSGWMEATATDLVESMRAAGIPIEMRGDVLEALRYSTEVTAATLGRVGLAASASVWVQQEWSPTGFDEGRFRDEMKKRGWKEGPRP